MGIGFLSILISLKCNSVHSLLISYIITVSLNLPLLSTMTIWFICRRNTCCNASRNTEIVYCKETSSDNLGGLVREKVLECSFARWPGGMRKLLWGAAHCPRGLGSQKSHKAMRASASLHLTRVSISGCRELPTVGEEATQSPMSRWESARVSGVFHRILSYSFCLQRGSANCVCDLSTVQRKIPCVGFVLRMHRHFLTGLEA